MVRPFLYLLMGCICIWSGSSDAAPDPYRVRWASHPEHRLRKEVDYKWLHDRYVEELSGNPDEVKTLILWPDAVSSLGSKDPRVALFFKAGGEDVYLHFYCPSAQKKIKTYLQMDGRFDLDHNNYLSLLKPWSFKTESELRPKRPDILSLAWISKALLDASKRNVEEGWFEDILQDPSKFRWSRILTYHRPHLTTFYSVFDGWSFRLLDSEEADRVERLMRPWYFIFAPEAFHKPQGSPASSEESLDSGVSVPPKALDRMKEDYQNIQAFCSKLSIQRLFFPKKRRAEREKQARFLEREWLESAARTGAERRREEAAEKGLQQSFLTSRHAVV